MARRRILTMAAGATLTIAGLTGCYKEPSPPLNPPPPPPPINVNPPPPDIEEMRPLDAKPLSPEEPNLLLETDHVNPPSPGLDAIPEAIPVSPDLPPPPPGVGPTVNPPPPQPGVVPEPVRPELLPTWNDVESGHPPGATNPPIPELVVTPTGECYKTWRAARIAYRPDRPVGDRVQECAPGDCGERIQCPEERAQALLNAFRAEQGGE